LHRRQGRALGEWTAYVHSSALDLHGGCGGFTGWHIDKAPEPLLSYEEVAV